VSIPLVNVFLNFFHTFLAELALVDDGGHLGGGVLLVVVAAFLSGLALALALALAARDYLLALYIFGVLSGFNLDLLLFGDVHYVLYAGRLARLFLLGN